MASNRSGKAKRTEQPARTATVTDIREWTPSRKTEMSTSQPASTALPRDCDSEATARTTQRAAIEQAVAQRNIRLARSRSAAPPRSSMLLLLGLLALAGLLGVWLMRFV